MFTRGNGNSGPVLINFNYSYFGRSYSQVTVNTNGFVWFSTGNWIPALIYYLDTRTSGGIYYQNLNSQSSDFASIKSDINRRDASFVPTNIFRVTYLNVPYIGQTSHIVSFQIVLASDASKSYVLLKYATCLSSAYSIRTRPGLGYMSAGMEKPMYYHQISNPCTSSNVNLPGTWVFDVPPLNSKN